MNYQNTKDARLIENKVDNFDLTLLCANSDEFCTTLSFYCLLTKIDISESSIKTIPDDFCNLSVLSECHLSNNMIEQLPNDFHQLKMLRILRLDSNKLFCIQCCFDELTELAVLDLYNNEILDIYCDLDRLVSLDIAMNFIEESGTEKYTKQKCSLRNRYYCTSRDDGSKPPYDSNQYLYDHPSLVVDDEKYEVWDSDGSWDLDFKIAHSSKPKDPLQALLDASIASGRFCPADMHQKPIPKTVFTFEYEPGDFDDASE